MVDRRAANQKFSRQEIVDIIERNFDLYRNEPNFIKYLVELTIYLVEFQYDSSRSAEADGDLERDNTPAFSKLSGASIIAALQTTFGVKGRKEVCPFCNAKLKSEKICPGCGLKIPT
jgi:hypothetical protein